MEQILPKEPGIVCYIDDVLITGKNDKEHLHRLEQVLKSLKENGLTIKMSKCHFLQPSVQYLGKIISKDGIIPYSRDERPIAYASKTLSDSEKNYSQIEHEALGIVFGIRKFHQHLYGHKFSLLIDYKPLLAIFRPKKGIPATAANRLQRWAILLSAYAYDIEFKPTKEHGNADMLSRLPVGPNHFFGDQQGLNVVVNLIQDSQVQELPVNYTQVQ